MVAPSHQLKRIFTRVTEEVQRRLEAHLESRGITHQEWSYRVLMAALEREQKGAAPAPEPAVDPGVKEAAPSARPGADLTARVLDLDVRLAAIVQKAQEAARVDLWVQRSLTLHAAFNNLVNLQRRLTTEEAKLEHQLAEAKRERDATAAPQPEAAAETLKQTSPKAEADLTRALEMFEEQGIPVAPKSGQS